MSDNDSSTVVDGNEPSETAYDRIAEGYAQLNASSLMNEFYNRPAIIELAGDVEGRRILDAGCGTGPILADLRDRGAEVVGIDSSAQLLQHARERLGSNVDLRVADLASPLPFEDDAFDDIVASLVLHYMPDWGPTLAEFHRVLRPGGRLIVSEEHPAAVFLADKLAGKDREYFGIHKRLENWDFGEQSAELIFWDRPLHAMTDAFAEAGFRISVISEPGPAAEAFERFPELKDRPSGRFLAFLFFVLEAC
ncbi:class I SAM-dependent methyltransferase [Leifsonia soli]|uniref:Ubiquinone/menaquinone biosynthesis C-methylase UbiE n=1 Tax=Leifsonia soli TaxID=582665 RepID=A0A852T004_9MICO|nr:class I SAM-dependent methyltransferase [Leifsonia soli]NYD74192.1 ubiquinone/menaquinone biosynthesis C-methylase UbiE [Leifsonia soli]